MKKVILFFTLATFILTSCSSDDSDNSSSSQDLLIGTWTWHQSYFNGEEQSLDDCDKMDTIVINSDGTFNESFFYDDNGISIDGSTQLSFTDDTEKRLNSYGWNYIKIDGHNHNSIRSSIKKAQKSKKPTMIACKTKIGFGSPNKVNSHESHGAPLGKDEIELTRKNLNWN